MMQKKNTFQTIWYVMLEFTLTILRTTFKNTNKNNVKQAQTYTWWICTGMYAKHPCIIVWMVVSRGIVYPVKPATNEIISYICVN